jgi:hypothetical protein
MIHRMTMAISRPARLLPPGGWLFLASMLVAPAVAAQPNLSFTLGATDARIASGTDYVGLSIGGMGKFEISDHIRIRGQFNVDKLQLEQNSPQNVGKDQSQTFMCLGAGVEGAIGTKDFKVFANLTPHGTIRTTMRTGVADGGDVRFVSVTRFSMGAVAGAGAEVFITDNLGLEGQLQYDIFNFDSDAGDPQFKGVRVLLGLQFYLGLNYRR